MTLVASWFNNENPNAPSIWTASDTKIIFEHGGTLEASKVFELNVVCKDQAHNHRDILFRSTLTFSYAGSTMLAVNTFATLNTILSNLAGGNKRIHLRPDCESILRTASAVMHTHNESIRTEAQIIIAGVCPKTNRLFIGKTTSWIEDHQIHMTNEVMFNSPEVLTYTLIGSHTEVVRERITQHVSIRETLSKHHYWRSPLLILADIVNRQEYMEIGGNIQLAIVDAFKGNQLLSVEPNIVWGKQSTQKYQNIDMQNAVGKFVGECLIAIGGMIIDIDSVDTYAKERWPGIDLSSRNKK